MARDERRATAKHVSLHRNQVAVRRLIGSELISFQKSASLPSVSFSLSANDEQLPAKRLAWALAVTAYSTESAHWIEGKQEEGSERRHGLVIPVGEARDERERERERERVVGERGMRPRIYVSSCSRDMGSNVCLHSPPERRETDRLS